MKTFILIATLIFLTQPSVQAKPVCINDQGNYWVYEPSLQRVLGSIPYSAIEFCHMAIKSADPSLACAVASDGNSRVYSSNTGAIVGWPEPSFASVRGCSMALQAVVGDIMCVPRLSGFVVFNHSRGQQVGRTGYVFNYVDDCRKASLSASVEDDLVCSHDSQGYVGVFHKVTNEKIGSSYRNIAGCLWALRGIKID